MQKLPVLVGSYSHLIIAPTRVLFDKIKYKVDGFSNSQMFYFPVSIYEGSKNQNVLVIDDDYIQKAVDNQDRNIQRFGELEKLLN